MDSLIFKAVAASAAVVGCRRISVVAGVPARDVSPSQPNLNFKRAGRVELLYPLLIWSIYPQPFSATSLQSIAMEDQEQEKTSGQIITMDPK